MAKKKNKQLIRPWCWYCEREFEDEKVLMQHQKAKHFKCGMCPRRLNTAGGLAVHIQQVHKLEPENLPRIDNALPGRDGYEVEIFGMEGIPAPDVADYKRRKEIELGLSAGSISQPPPKRAKVENRPIAEDELRAQLEAHKALMGNNAGTDSQIPAEASAGPAVYGAPAQAYAVPPSNPTPSPGIFGAPPPYPLPPGVTPPFPPFPPGMHPGAPPLGYPGPPGFSPAMSPPFPPGGARPPFPPPNFLPPGVQLPPGAPGFSPPLNIGATSPPPPQFVPAQMQQQFLPQQAVPSPAQAAPTPPQPHPRFEGRQEPPRGQVQPPQLTLPNPALAQTNGDFKKPTSLKYTDPNFSPDERRSVDPKYYYPKNADVVPAPSEESRGKKRARAEDFL